MIKDILNKYLCIKCNYHTYQWFGKCPSCGTWDSIQESKQLTKSNKNIVTQAVKLQDIQDKQLSKYKTQIHEFDNMMNGGIIPSSLILIGGPPGVGKSTLMLHIASNLGHIGTVLYISGEESALQIKSRSKRIKITETNIFILSETNINNIIVNIQTIRPCFVIIDSIQTIYSPDFGKGPGAIIQVKEIAIQLLHVAKLHNITMFILGHITKDGDLAGPKILEHIVDTVLYFDNERYNTYRILRVHKNRYGPTNVIGFFKMDSLGLSEVLDSPSFYCKGNNHNVAGNILTVAVEGTRPILVEVQALTIQSSFSIPRRIATGYDIKRIIILIAVIEKRLNKFFNMKNKDVFINITSGIKIKETSIDAAIVTAIISSTLDFVCPKHTVICGELGLSGELRCISFIIERLSEAERLGFKQAIIPTGNLSNNHITYNGKINIQEAQDIATIIELLNINSI